MLNDLLKFLETDATLKRLLDKAREYAQVYLLAKQRQKGCDEMGEVATLEDEFSGSLEEMIVYCKEKKYIPDDFSYDTELITEEILKV
jgi:hypothetical protein